MTGASLRLCRAAGRFNDPAGYERFRRVVRRDWHDPVPYAEVDIAAFLPGP
jgi:hypothetical protein